ncbi:metacaspase-9 [Malania oleifera]|uniref:metacaspase-9 n=1 Tax=Malania oleifera TaxID=397392 RepID=UPI0025AE8E67|nr:metacaspase-9 [Malania oleifera]
MENKNGGQKRLAVLVGCNYPNTRNELHGCINDVLAMQDMLLNRFGFQLGDIELLIDDAPGPTIMPTGTNIKAALDRMVDQAQSKDVLFFHYSGHGTLIPSLKRGHPFRHEEAIVPCDFNLITDLDFRQLVNRLPEGVSFTMVSDSCHSGGLIDKEKEQIGPSTFTSSSAAPPPPHQLSLSKLRTIPFDAILNHLASLTNINTPDIGTHLLQLFGSDASPRFRLPPFEAEDLLTARLRPDAGILLSGCQAEETSADVTADPGGGRKACGAFSNAVQSALKEHAEKLSNREVVMMARKVLEVEGFEGQHPCLYCSDENADAVFLSQPDGCASDQ